MGAVDHSPFPLRPVDEPRMEGVDPTGPGEYGRNWIRSFAQAASLAFLSEYHRIAQERFSWKVGMIKIILRTRSRHEVKDFRLCNH